MIAVLSPPQEDSRDILMRKVIAWQGKIARKAKNRQHESPEDFCGDILLELSEKVCRGDLCEISWRYVSWLVHRRLVDHSRKRRLPVVKSHESSSRHLAAECPDLEASGGKMDLESYLSELSTKDRDIIERRYFWCQDTAETADDLGLTSDGVRSRVHRACVKLRVLANQNDRKGHAKDTHVEETR